MTRRIALIAFALWVLASGGLAVAAAQASPTAPAFLTPLFGDRRPQPSLVFSYHGWRVNAARTARIQKPATTVRAIKTQLDIVEHVGLSPKVLAFMRSVPVTGTPGSGPEPGLYARGRGVSVHVKSLDDKRPIILRQLLYAYQDQVLPGGFANPDVTRFRQDAAGKHVWPMTATMLKDDPDYFAMTASAFLYGTITREPYTRADLLKTQPEAYRWLAGLFGTPRGRP